MASSALIDTHALLWWLADSEALSARAKDLIGRPATEILVSAGVTWEIEIKRALGKLEAPGDLLETLQREGFAELPITWADTVAAGRLTQAHRDPFDRLLIAQAATRGLPIITDDPMIGRYDVETIF